MSNREKYAKIFIDSFRVNEKDLPALKYQAVDNWDSIGHVKMIADLEEAFDIMMETEDIIDFSSYVKGVDILKKYGVVL
jgi:acyl carrier protein